MARKPRVEAAGAIHHVIARGIADIAIVDDNSDRRDLVKSLGRAADRHGWLVHAYCLMDTHVHAVLETPEPTLGKGMQRLLGGYAFEFNRRHGRHGHLFAGRYSASIVDSDSYAITLCAYVALNPVRAGVVSAPEDWEWSSYRATAGLIRAPSFLATRLVPGMLHSDRGRAQELYRELVRDAAQHPTPGSG
jgi:putative transposase